MRIQSSLVRFALILGVVSSGSIAADDHPVTSIIVSRPADVSYAKSAKDRWFAALCEEFFHYRLGALLQVDVVTRDQLTAEISAYTAFEREIPAASYLSVARKLGCSYIVDQKYELVESDKVVQYYVEVLKVSSNRIIQTIEKKFPVEETGVSLDTMVVRMLEVIGIKVPKETERFFGMTLLSKDPRSLRELGEIMLLDKYSTGDNSAEAAQRYGALLQRDPRMELAYFLGGEASMRANRYRKAAEYFRNLFEIMPEYIPLYLEYTRALRGAKNNHEAFRIASLGESKHPTSLELIKEKAEVLEELGQKAEAERAYSSMLKLDPNNSDALLFLARAANDRGRPDEALEHIEKVLRISKNSGKAFFEKGRSFQLKGKTEEARQAFKVAAELMPENPYAAMELGDLLMGKNEFASAADQFLRATELLPNEYEVHEKAALALKKAGKISEAASVLKSIEGRFSTNSRLQKELGLLELSLGDSTNARRHLETCYHDQKKDPRVLMGLGDIYVGVGMFDDAYKMYNSALPIIDDTNAPRIGLARLYLLKNAPQQAMAYLNEVMNKDPDYPLLNGFFADARYALGDRQAALRHYLRERELYKTNPHIQQRIAYLYYLDGKWNDAEREYVSLLDLQPGHIDGNYRLGITYLHLKVKPKAKEYLTKAESLGPPNKDILFDMGRAFTSVGLLDKAIDAYRACLKLEPKWEQALLELSDVLIASQRDKETAEVYVKLFQLDNQKYEEQLADAGHIFYRLGLKSDAKNAYTLFLQKGFSKPEVKAKLAQLVYEETDHKKVISLLEGIEGEWSRHEPTLMILAESYFATGSFAKTIPVTKKVLDVNTKQIRATQLLALSNEKVGDLGKAAEAYKAYLSFPETDLHQQYSFHLGEIYEKVGDESAAIQQYTATSRSYPQNVASYDRLARIYYSRQDWVNCEKVLLDAVALPSSSPQLQKMLAQSLAAQGKHEEAVTWYQKYLTMAPSDSSGWRELGSLFYQKGQFQRAVAPLKMAVKHMPGNTDCMFMLGKSFFETGSLNDAAEMLAKVHQHRTEDIQVIGLLAQAYRSLKDTTHLVAVLKEWANVDSRNYDIRQELGEMLLAQNATNEAIEYLNQAVRLQRSNPVPYRILARAYKAVGNEKQWLASLTSVIEFAPRDPEAHFQIGEYYLHRNQDHKAEPYLVKAIEFSSVHAAARFEYGRMLDRLNKPQDAYALYKEASRIDGTSAVYAAHLAKSAYGLGKIDEALNAAEHALGNNSQSVEILYMCSKVYGGAGQTVRAKQLLRDALSIDGDCKECHEALGEAYIAEANYKQAVKALMKAWELGGYNEQVVLTLARALSSDRKYEEAKDFLELVLSKNAKNDRAVYELVTILCHQGDFRNAEKAIENFEKKYQKTGWIHLASGVVYEYKGETDPAWIAYNVAVRLLPNEPQVQAACGRIHLTRRQFETAVEYFGRALAADPNNPSLLVNLAEALEGLNELDEAIGICTSVVERFPDHPEAFYVMARIYSRKDDHATALSVAEKGLAGNPREAKLLYIRGHELRALGRFAEAVQSYEDALRESGGSFVEAYRHIANTYFEDLKDTEKAKEYYKKYLKAGGRNIEAKDRLSSLDG